MSNTKSTAMVKSARRRDERGMTTAEYAVGTVAAAGLGGLMIKILTDEQMRQLLWKIIETALKVFITGQ